MNDDVLATHSRMRLCPRCRDRGDLPYMFNEMGLTRLGVEVGVRRGEYSKILLDKWRGEMLYLVDPWGSPSEEYEEVGYSQADSEDVKVVLSLVDEYEGRCGVLRATSVQALHLVPNDLDFVYIDANHDYRYVWQDMRIWWPKLRYGGILAGHDLFYLNILGVTQAVTEFAVKYRLDLRIVPGSSDNVCRDGQVGSWYFVKE